MASRVKGVAGRPKGLAQDSRDDFDLVGTERGEGSGEPIGDQLK